MPYVLITGKSDTINEKICVCESNVTSVWLEASPPPVRKRAKNYFNNVVYLSCKLVQPVAAHELSALDECISSLQTNRLTHDSTEIQCPILLLWLHPWHKIPQSNGAQRDETEVDAIQKAPGLLQLGEDGCWHHKKAQHHQKQQQHKVDSSGGPRLQAWSLKQAHRSEDQRVQEPLDTGGEHQHGKGNS